ncbi:Dynein light chain, cytoplasmic-like protein [Drosera capensis]
MATSKETKPKNIGKDKHYVYNIGTVGSRTPDHPPPMTTVTNRVISIGWGLRKSKSVKECVTGQQMGAKGGYAANGRKSLCKVEEGQNGKVETNASDWVKVGKLLEERKSVSCVEGVKGYEGKLLEKGRKSNGHNGEIISLAYEVEVNKVQVLVTDMPGFMQGHAFRCARRTFDSMEKFSAKLTAFNLKKEFDKVYGPAWHCIVGSSFGSFVTHCTRCFLYFSMENLYVLLFKTKVQKRLETDYV